LEHLRRHHTHTRIVRISDGACLDGTDGQDLEQQLTDIDRFDIPPTEFPDSTTHTHYFNIFIVRNLYNAVHTNPHFTHIHAVDCHVTHTTSEERKGRAAYMGFQAVLWR
jgi:hypothetical protein